MRLSLLLLGLLVASAYTAHFEGFPECQIAGEEEMVTGQFRPTFAKDLKKQGNLFVAPGWKSPVRVINRQYKYAQNSNAHIAIAVSQPSKTNQGIIAETKPLPGNATYHLGFYFFVTTGNRLHVEWNGKQIFSFQPTYQPQTVGTYKNFTVTSIEGVNQLRFSFSKRGAATAVNYGVNYISLKRDPNEIIESDLKYKAAQNALKNELDEEVALWEDEIVSVKESLNTYQHNQREIKTLLESEIERAQYLTNISSIYKTVLEDLEELLGKPDIEIDPELEKKIEEVNELL